MTPEHSHSVHGRATAAGPRPRGFTVLELLVVLSVAALLLGVVAPKLLSSSASVALSSARSKVTSSVSIARSTATRHGRVTYLVLDAAMDRIRVEVDTSFVGNQAPITVHTLDLWQDLGVDLRATEPVLCFDPRGLSVASGVCPGTGVVVSVHRGDRADSVTVSSTGRVES